jgi:hypothetical protein
VARDLAHHLRRAIGRLENAAQRILRLVRDLDALVDAAGAALDGADGVLRLLCTP